MSSAGQETPEAPGDGPSTRPSTLVSVVLPAYDPGPRLRLALADVLAQSIDRWECLVIDDGGHEDLRWVDDLDPRIRRHRQDNAGVSSARNVGVALAEAPLVAFLDQDDRWHPDRLRVSLELAERRPEAAFWATQFRWQLPDRSAPHESPSAVSHLGLLAGGGVCQSAVTVRRADYLAVGGQEPRLRMCQDFEFALRLTAHLGAPIEVDERELVTYVVHEDNASKDFWRTDRELCHVYRAQWSAARAAGNARAAAAAATGLRLRRRTHAYQAIDVARTAWHADQRRRVVTALAGGAWCSPQVLARESARHVLRVVRAL